MSGSVLCFSDCLALSKASCLLCCYAGQSGTRLRCPTQPCVPNEEKAVGRLDMEESPPTTWFRDSERAVGRDDEPLRPGLLPDFEIGPSNLDPYEDFRHGPQVLCYDPEPLLDSVNMDVSFDTSAGEKQSAGLAFEDEELDREYAMQVDWESSSQVSEPFQAAQRLEFVHSWRPRSALEQGVASRSPAPISPLSPSFSELDYAQGCSYLGPSMHPAEYFFNKGHDSEASRVRESAPASDVHTEPQWDLFEPVPGRYNIATRRQPDASSGTGSGLKKADQSKLEKAPRLRSAQDVLVHNNKDLLDPQPSGREGIGRQKVVEDRAQTAAASRKKRKRGRCYLLPRRPHSAPPFARPKKRYGPESGASLESSNPAKGW